MEFFGQFFDYTRITTWVCTLGMYYQEYRIVAVSFIIVDYVIVICFVLVIFKFHYHLPHGLILFALNLKFIIYCIQMFIYKLDFLCQKYYINTILFCQIITYSIYWIIRLSSITVNRRFFELEFYWLKLFSVYSESILQGILKDMTISKDTE